MGFFFVHFRLFTNFSVSNWADMITRRDCQLRKHRRIRILLQSEKQQREVPLHPVLLFEKRDSRYVVAIFDALVVVDSSEKVKIVRYNLIDYSCSFIAPGKTSLVQI